MTLQHHAFDDDAFEPEANAHIEFEKEILGNSALCTDLGLNPQSCRVLHIFVAGDGVHPTKGIGYIRKDWESIPEEMLWRSTRSRNRLANKHISKLKAELLQNGEEAARTIAMEVPCQIAFICANRAEIVSAHKQLAKHGCDGFSDTDFFMFDNGNGLAILYNEDCTHFLRDC